MDITWDATKNEKNRKKHGVTFEEAATVLLNPISSVYQDDCMSEDRQIWVGHSAIKRLLLVIVCERLEENQIRIISARKTTAAERKAYEEGI